jgi:dTDP-L-rhamnose 4-epimerase
MRILVTGGAGFIGSRVVARFLAHGHDVRVVDALIAGVHPADESFTPPASAEFVHGDLRDEQTVDGVLRGIDVVCHQAAMVGRGGEILEAQRYVACNDLGTAILLAAMTRAGVTRMIHASSVVIYGDSRHLCEVHGRVRPHRRSREDLEAGRFEPRCPDCGRETTVQAVQEDDPLDPPHNVYAVSKLAQEYLVRAWARETGGTAVALRYHNVYGPGMPYASPYSGVASAFRTSVARGEAPRVFEDGGPRRDFIHVDDVASANVAALSFAGAGFRAYNVASGIPRTIGELATALAATAGAPAPLITGEFRIGDVRHIFATPDRIIAELGWAPAIPFEAGIASFASGAMRGGPA